MLILLSIFTKMSSGKKSHRIYYEGPNQQKSDVMKALVEEMFISQEDIDTVYASFGEKCLVSVEKFFEYKEIQEITMPLQREKGAHSLFEDDHTEASVNDGKEGAKRPLSAEDNKVTQIGDTDSEIYDEDKEIEDHISKFGLKNIKEPLQRNLEGMKKEPLDIAIIGMSGKGKSSLINAFRNFQPDDKRAAKVGEEECTMLCKPYSHPQHKSFIFWDVPGVGTVNFPQNKYFDKIKVDRYDFFFILSSERFNVLDSWLAKEITLRNKRFYFIRTKIDFEMYNIKQRKKDEFEEENEFKTLKKTIKEKIERDINSCQFHLFLISSLHPTKYDFPLLLQQLLIDVPKEKKRAMVFGIAGMSKTVIEVKASALGSRIWKCALLSGVGAAIPIPFLSGSIDTAIILEELLFYRGQFALDDDSLRHLANMADISLEELKENVKFETPEEIFTAGGLAKYLTKYAASEAAEKVAQYTIPGIGIAIACGISFVSTMGVLKGILDMMKKDAINVLVYVSMKETAL